MKFKSTSVLLVMWFSHVLCDLNSKYRHHVTLDEFNKYHLYWTVKDDMIHFAVEVDTLGWVGLGFSTGTGQMDKADIIMGWVKDGQGYIQDRFADGYGVPSLDNKQDVKLTGFKEEGGKTTLEFTRKITTCDEKDHPINDGTVRLIWSYHTSDPDSKTSVFQKHTSRGTKAVMLLNSYKGNSTLPEDTVTYDFMYEKVNLPSDDTTYWCRMFKIPETAGKRHIIMIEPIVQSGNEGIVHHMVMYTCMSNFNTTHENVSSPCDHPNMPSDVYRCRRTILYAWAIGAGNFTFPEHAGFALGDDDSPVYVMLEIHYDNPQKKSGLVDSSGVRFYVTPQLRQFDADMLMLGHDQYWNIMVIPPKQKDFLITGYCNKECTEKTIPEEGMNIFAIAPHTHLTGHSVHIRHVRDGKELPPLLTDDNYDFNFQEYQYLNEEVKIKSGDELITECRYNTLNKVNATLGGDGTQEEMCYGFVLYYPRNPRLRACYSANLNVVLLTNSRMHYNMTTRTYETRWDEVSWKDEYTVELRGAYEKPSAITLRCSGVNGSTPGVRFWQNWFSPPNITEEYTKKDVCYNLPTTESSVVESGGGLDNFSCSMLCFCFGFIQLIQFMLM